MTSASSTSPPMTDLERLSVKPEAATSGFVDGAWWPASRDLAAELSAVVAGLADRLGDVERVTYNLDSWEAVPRKIKIGSSVVRMGGFHSQLPATIDVIGERRRLTLLIVPPDTDAQVAHGILAAASRAGSTEGIDTLLSTGVGNLALAGAK